MQSSICIAVGKIRDFTAPMFRCRRRCYPGESSGTLSHQNHKAGKHKLFAAFSPLSAEGGRSFWILLVFALTETESCKSVWPRVWLCPVGGWAWTQLRGGVPRRAFAALSATAGLRGAAGLNLASEGRRG